MEKTGKKRPWKSLRDFHFSHSFNNNKLDDRDHFLQNAKTSVASLRRLITPTRNADHDQPGTLINFIGICTLGKYLSKTQFANYLPTLGLAGWHYTQGVKTPSGEGRTARID